MLRSVGGTVFQTAVLSMVINPETASRVTLAYARYWLPARPTNNQLNNKTTKQQDNLFYIFIY